MKRIDSNQNPKIKGWKKLLTKKEREKTGLFLIEGHHLIEEALKHDIVDCIIMSEETKTIKAADNVEVYLVPTNVVKELSETESPQGIVAVCRKQQWDGAFEKGRYLLIDAVQDPGNVGTMIRTADAAGFDGVVLGNGCVDQYNSKVIRATQGSLFHIPVIKRDLEDVMNEMQSNGIAVYGTALENAVSYKEVEKTDNVALLVGNEGSGVNPALLVRTTQNLYIPIHGGAESLNVAVAAGILLYALR
ncbi:MAG: TrmH family RNA methyltransferase [Bacillaceae bacterium]